MIKSLKSLKSLRSLKSLTALTAFFLILPLGLLAQQRDSLALAHARWQTDTLHPGLILKTASIPSLFGAPQCIALLEIQPSSPRRLAFSHQPRRTLTSAQARQRGALAAVNGSFFDMQEHHPICFLRIDGHTLGENTPGADTANRKYYQYGTLALQEGKPLILKTDSSRHWERRLPWPDIMTAGPLLIFQGKPQPMRKDRTFVTQRHNRTAIAILSDGTTLLFTVDGRMPQSAGMSLRELTLTLRWLGARDALNLDGGGSTTLWVSDRIVNYPTDNGRFDHAGERKVSNAILVF